MNSHLAHLEALSSQCTMCQKFGLDYRAHLVQHQKILTSVPNQQPPKSPTSNSAQSDATSQPIPVGACEQSGTESQGAVDVMSADSKTDESVALILAASSGGRITRQRLEAHNTGGPLTNPSLKRPLKVSSPTPKTTVPTPPITSPTIAPLKIQLLQPPPAKKAKKQNQIKGFVETLGKDVLSDQNLMDYNRVDQKALVFGATASKVASKRRKCALCEFSAESKPKFLAHIKQHRAQKSKRGIWSRDTSDTQTKANKETFDVDPDFLQCKECGMCFASEPSWKKHLFLLHRIKKPQLSDYCDDLVQTIPLGQNQGHESQTQGQEGQTQSHEGQDQGHESQDQGHVSRDQGYDCQNEGHEGHNQGHEDDESFESKTELSNQRMCNVCQIVLPNEEKLTLHFQRYHRMAFISQQN